MIKINETKKIKSILEEIENTGYTFINDENELVDTAKSKFF